MGSSSKPQKISDRKPLQRLHGGSGSASGGEKTKQCPVVFRVKLNNSSLLKQGLQLTMNEKHELLYSGNVVGVVPKSYQTLINHCADEGVTYTHIVVVLERTGDTTTYYAQFQQG